MTANYTRDFRPQMIARELNANPDLTDEQREAEYERRVSELRRENDAATVPE